MEEGREKSVGIEMKNAARFAAIEGRAALFERVDIRVLDRLFKQMEFSYMNKKSSTIFIFHMELQKTILVLFFVGISCLYSNLITFFNSVIFVFVQILVVFYFLFPTFLLTLKILRKLEHH